MQYRSILSFLFFVFAKTTLAQDATGHNGEYNLQQCVEIAINNSPDVKQKEFAAATGKINWDQAKDNVLPTVNGSISHTFYNGRSINSYTNSYINQSYNAGNYQLYSSFTVWNGSSIQNYIKKCALDYKASELEVQQAKDQLTLQVILNYLTVLTAKEQLNIAVEQAGKTAENVKALTAKYNEGVVGIGEISDIKGQYASDEMSVISTKNALANARLLLAQSMNIPYDSTMQLAEINAIQIPQEYPSSIDDIYAAAAGKLAMVKSADARLASAFKNISYIKGQRMPSLILSGGVYTNYSSAATTSTLINTTDVATDNYILNNGNKVPVYSPQAEYATHDISYGNQWKNNINTSVGLSLQIPILNGFQVRNKIRLAKVEMQQADYTSKTIRIQLRQAIEQDYFNMRFSFATYKTLLQQVEDYNQSLYAANVKFKNGVITTVDYVIAMNNYQRASMNLVASKYDYILRTKMLDYYLGISIY